LKSAEAQAAFAAFLNKKNELDLTKSEFDLTKSETD